MSWPDLLEWVVSRRKATARLLGGGRLGQDPLRSVLVAGWDCWETTSTKPETPFGMYRAPLLALLAGGVSDAPPDVILPRLDAAVDAMEAWIWRLIRIEPLAPVEETFLDENERQRWRQARAIEGADTDMSARDLGRDRLVAMLTGETPRGIALYLAGLREHDPEVFRRVMALNFRGAIEKRPELLERQTWFTGGIGAGYVHPLHGWAAVAELARTAANAGALLRLAYDDVGARVTTPMHLNALAPALDDAGALQPLASRTETVASFMPLQTHIFTLPDAVMLSRDPKQAEEYNKAVLDAAVSAVRTA